MGRVQVGDVLERQHILELSAPHNHRPIITLNALIKIYDSKSCSPYPYPHRYHQRVFGRETQGSKRGARGADPHHVLQLPLHQCHCARWFCTHRPVAQKDATDCASASALSQPPKPAAAAAAATAKARRRRRRREEEEQQEQQQQQQHHHNYFNYWNYNH